MEYRIEQIQLDGHPAAVVRGLMPESGIPGFLGGAFGEVMTVVADQGIRPSGMPFACYVPTPDGFQVEAGVATSAPVEPSGRVIPSTLPGGPAISVLHRGPYGEVTAAYEAAEAWLRDSEWEAAGPPWEAYLDGPDVTEPRTVVYFPTRHRRLPGEEQRSFAGS